jgi:calcineurin-like phosphoesterase family protein
MCWGQKMNRWFSADFHLGHLNIIKYCDRQFSNTHEMNEAIIANHNACVQPDDEFYHLGDFSWMSVGYTIEALKRMNGKKFMIRGNHDKILDRPEVQQYYTWIKDYHRLMVPDKSIRGGQQIIILCHYAMRVWDQKHRSSMMLYGHSHNGLPDDPTLLSIDVGVDCHDFKPFSYEEIKSIMEKKTPIKL